MIFKGLDFTKISGSLNKYELKRDVLTRTGIFGRKFDSEYISMTDSGLMIQRKYYRWNGCNGMTIDSESSNWWHGSTMHGGCAHDGGYQALQEGWLIAPNLSDEEYYRVFCRLRKSFDDMLQLQFLSDNIGSFRAGYYHYFVRKFGEKYALPKRLK